MCNTQQIRVKTHNLRVLWGLIQVQGAKHLKINCHKITRMLNFHLAFFCHQFTIITVHFRNPILCQPDQACRPNQRQPNKLDWAAKALLTHQQPAMYIQPAHSSSADQAQQHIPFTAQQYFCSKFSSSPVPTAQHLQICLQFFRLCQFNYHQIIIITWIRGELTHEF